MCMIQGGANSSDVCNLCKTFAICLCEITSLTRISLPFLYLKNVERIYTTQKSCWLTNNHSAWFLAFRRVARFLLFAMSTRILLLRIPQCATDQHITLRTTTHKCLLEIWHILPRLFYALQYHLLIVQL